MSPTINLYSSSEFYFTRKQTLIESLNGKALKCSNHHKPYNSNRNIRHNKIKHFSFPAQFVVTYIQCDFILRTFFYTQTY